MQRIIIGLILAALMLEGSLTSLPLVLSALIIFRAIIKSDLIYLLAFVSGIFLDIFLVRHLGQTSIIFLVIFFLTSLYEKKFEVDSLLFVTIATCLTSFFYLSIYTTPDRLAQVGVMMILSGFFYTVLSFKKHKEQATVGHL